MTPEQLEDILEKAETVHTLKLAYEVALSEHNTSITNANNAQASWQSGVNAGEDEATLTNLLNQRIATAVAQQEKLTALNEANVPYGDAIAALNSAVDAVIAEALLPP